MIAIFHYSEPIQRIKNINFLSFSWKINRKWFYYFLIWKGVSIKRSFKLRDSTSSNFLPNYSLSSGRKLYRRSSTSHSLFLMRWCAKNLAEIIDFWWNSIDFDGFSNFHEKCQILECFIEAIKINERLYFVYYTTQNIIFFQISIDFIFENYENSFQLMSRTRKIVKKSLIFQNSTSSKFLPNYSLSSWRKLYRRSSTSHCYSLLEQKLCNYS